MKLPAALLASLQPGAGTAIGRFLAENVGSYGSLFAALTLVTVAATVWAVFWRKKRRQHRRYHRDSVQSTETSASPASVEGGGAEVNARRHRKHRRRREHRPRNPTLAETGGLPPARNELPPAAFP